MTDKICELHKIINDNKKTHDDAYEKKCAAERELESLLRVKCKAYDKICKTIEMCNERGFYSIGASEYFRISGLETARGYLKEWLISEYCKE